MDPCLFTHIQKGPADCHQMMHSSMVYIYRMICEISNFSGIFVQTAPHSDVALRNLPLV